MLRGLPRRPPAHPAAPALGTPLSAWTQRQYPGTCPQRSSPCEWPPGLGVGWETGQGLLWVGGRTPIPSLQSVGTRSTLRDPQCWGLQVPAIRELCSLAGSAAMTEESQSSWPRMNHHQQQPLVIVCACRAYRPGRGGVYMSMCVPACDVTPRTESRRRDGSWGRGDKGACPHGTLAQGRRLPLGQLLCTQPGQHHLQQLAPGSPCLRD